MMMIVKIMMMIIIKVIAITMIMVLIINKYSTKKRQHFSHTKCFFRPTLVRVCNVGLRPKGYPKFIKPDADTHS